ncbi:MAG TPA: glycosyltransferase [Pirellulales bacterium]|nr:glycosyltransferase [Pirellulales bacterium]
MVTENNMANIGEAAEIAPGRPPIVSVLLPVYNQKPALLEVACGSILAQTFRDFEFVVVDDGSRRRDTVAWLDGLADNDARVRVYHEPHRGLTRTLNVGLAYCRGDFICRQDSDDWSDPQRLQSQIEFLQERSDLAVVGSWAMLHRDDAVPLWIDRLPTAAQDIAAAFTHQNPFCHGAICFRRAAAETIGGYREEFTTSQDYDFLWRLCERFGGENLPEVLYHRRFTATAISTNRARDQARNRALARRLGAMRSCGQTEDFPRAMQEAAGDEEGKALSALSTQGDYLLLSGHYLAALKAHLRAVLRAPWRQLPYLKTLRWALYVLAPALRPRLFGHMRSVENGMVASNG